MADPINGEQEELLDYEEEDAQENDTQAIKGSDQNRKGYVGIHATGFKDFALKPELLRAITDCGFEHPSEIQQEAIPQALVGTDVIGQAKSGMGKTAVFVISILHQLEPKDGEVSALILVHARELAVQVCAEFARFKKYMPNVRVAAFYGGIPEAEQKKMLQDPAQCPHVVVGTPGRVKKLVDDGVLKLSNVRHFILDECDKMLMAVDMRADVQHIFVKTPHSKQVMMFSATLSQSIRPVCEKFTHHPHKIFIDDETKLTLHGLVQHYVILNEDQKNRKLTEILDAIDFNQVVIFVKQVQRAKALAKLLSDSNFPTMCMHAAMPQEKRSEVFKKFRENHARILVATDLVGRGMDVEHVNVVINYDMPEPREANLTDEQKIVAAADTYLHRVGRAGRFGTKGLAITFVASAEDTQALNKVQDRFDVSITELPAQVDKAAYAH